MENNIYEYLDDETISRKKEIIDLKHTIEIQRDFIHDNCIYILKLKDQIKQYIEEIDYLKKIISNKESIIEDNVSKLLFSKVEISQLMFTLEKKNSQIDKQNKDIINLNNKVKDISRSNINKTEEFDKIKFYKNIIIDDMEEQIKNLNILLSQNEKLIGNLKTEIENRPKLNTIKSKIISDFFE